MARGTELKKPGRTFDSAMISGVLARHGSLGTTERGRKAWERERIENRVLDLPRFSAGALLLSILLVLAAVCPGRAETGVSQRERFASTIEYLSGLGNRETGSEGVEKAADYIEKAFQELEFGEVGTHRFQVPMMVSAKSEITDLSSGTTLLLAPIRGNAITPQTIGPPGMEAPLVYVGRGSLSEMSGRKIDGAVVLMELDSGRNWLDAASLGAKALIYLDRGFATRSFYEEKIELSPIRFPRFRLSIEKAEELFGEDFDRRGGAVSDRIRLICDERWENVAARNIYCLVEGADEELGGELVVVEAFYDSTAFVNGLSPGADEACGIATLLSYARSLKQNPPDRSVMLLATSAHAQTQAGMREAVWAIRARTIFQRRMIGDLKKTLNRRRHLVEVLQSAKVEGAAMVSPDIEKSDEVSMDEELREALSDTIKTQVDKIARDLMQLRLKKEGEADEHEIQKMADRRFMLRRLGWRADFKNLSDEEIAALEELIPVAIREHQAVVKDAKKQDKLLKSTRSFRSAVKSKELTASVSLHLSSKGEGVGAFNKGFMFPFRPRINRVSQYAVMNDVLDNWAAKSPYGDLYVDSLRPSRLRSWDSYFLDQPQLGCELMAIAGFHGISLVTVNDSRESWGIPQDTFDQVDMDYAFRQNLMAADLIGALTSAPKLHDGEFPRDGFSTLTGRAKFLRHGELFPDQAAPGAVLLCFQGPARFYAIVDAMGNFQLRGVVDKKHSYHKVIIEGYKFEPDTGKVVWAIDKPGTGKPAYRVKMMRPYMETDLIMFSARQTTIFDLLEPRTFAYMTKLNLIDGRREAPPMRYWYSRIDTRSSTIASLYLEPGTPLKMILSDSVLKKKLVLLNASEEHPQGVGYTVEDWPFIHNTAYAVASDMWNLLDPRIENLESHGIVDEKIRSLQKEGTDALSRAKKALEEYRYDRFSEATDRSWALASRVYDQVEKTQKDVLFGVLFYIALFVPFAFCMERLLFSYTNIYKRIVAFLTILMALIAVIYNVHPAFQLAYSPTVVILAFFIIGLSAMVTFIIFFRFEDEMVRLQKSATMGRDAEISKWKAFVAAFFLGVSNLRRRRLRTALTCATLVILTFTIMSFTAVKSSRLQTRLLYRPETPYKGFLLKSVNWQSLPPEALGIVENSFKGKGVAVPRVWRETEDRTRAAGLPVTRGDKSFEAQGLVGLSHREPEVTGMDEILTGGRWLAENERFAALIPERMAVSLGIDPEIPDGAEIGLWGKTYKVVGVFSGEKLLARTDLDGEPLTPAIFPRESAAVELTEVEMDAMESGEDVRAFQSLYSHVPGDLTVIVPHRTLMAEGGWLKAVSVRSPSAENVEKIAARLVDRFGLSLFSGEKDGTYLYNASDSLSYSGVPNILIPLIISVFIVLNTMIGSVYERKREIGIYTSVGLAPSHVSFLFVAESMAFAVISVVLGYLLAQTSASLFAGTSLWSGITVNYSSLAGVAAMFLVILVVLVSVVYPSKVAGEIAIPDVNRSWKLPETNGSELEVVLPFLVKYHEHRSIGGFVYEYFDAHKDVSHGIFSAGEIDFSYVCPMPERLAQARPECLIDQGCCQISCLNVDTRVWLAPFDFGIMQKVSVRFCPSVKEKGYLEITVSLARESGESNAWRRINKNFLHALRKQLLLWRGLDAEKKKHYERLLDDAQRERGIIAGNDTEKRNRQCECETA